MFKNDAGQIVLTRKVPKNITEKRAIEISIQKWEFIVKQLEARIPVLYGGRCETCALCIYNNYKEGCSTCIIALRTGRGGCAGTPWLKAVEDVTKKKSIRLPHARAEVKFLKSLRKEK